MAPNSADRQFEATSETILQAKWEFYPTLASSLGLHEYDGRLPDISAAAILRRVEEIETGLASLERIEVSSLSRQNRFDHTALTSSLHREMFELTKLKTHENIPVEMLRPLADVSAYIRGDYAPLEQRVESLISALRGVPSYVSSLQAGLSARLSRPILEASIESYQGVVSFSDNDLQQAVSMLGDPELVQGFQETRDVASQAVAGFVQHLEALQDKANDEFSIGARKFQKLLRYGEMIDLPLERLLEVGMEDLSRDLARFREAAAQIDPSRSSREVMAEVARDHPEAETLISETADMLEEIRRFFIDRDIVSVPLDIPCQTVETPSFMRWAFAAMDMPGPFETKATEAYYYETPVEDQWTDEQKEEWLTSFNYATLRTTSVHETYPGHYAHFLYTKSAPSKVSKVIDTYPFWEDWAHYTEEMMVEEGFAAGDPRLVLGQLSEALLRNCRCVCAIRMHSKGMTVDEATQFFINNAYLEELPASKEAMRGTFDPMCLNYTLGKLMIMELREDYRQEQRASFSLKGFHDTFLSFGAPPIPLLRGGMLQSPGTGVL